MKSPRSASNSFNAAAITEPGDKLGPGEEAAPTSTRPVCFDSEVGHLDTPVYWRPDLGAGATLTGPCVIEEFGSTVPVHPGFTVRVDGHANLVITREEKA